MEFIMTLARLGVVVGSSAIFYGIQHGQEIKTLKGKVFRWIFNISFTLFIVLNIWQLLGVEYPGGYKLIKYCSLAFVVNYMWFLYFYKSGFKNRYNKKRYDE